MFGLKTDLHSRAIFVTQCFQGRKYPLKHHLLINIPQRKIVHMTLRLGSVLSSQREFLFPLTIKLIHFIRITINQPILEAQL